MDQERLTSPIQGFSLGRIYEPILKLYDGNECIATYETQTKFIEDFKRLKKLDNNYIEFEKYLENEIIKCDDYFNYLEEKAKEIQGRAVGKTYLANEIMKNSVAKKVYEEILEKLRG